MHDLGSVVFDRIVVLIHPIGFHARNAPSPGVKLDRQPVNGRCRECLAAVPDTSISGVRVTRELMVLIARRGRPGMIAPPSVERSRFLRWLNVQLKKFERQL